MLRTRTKSTKPNLKDISLFKVQPLNKHFLNFVSKKAAEMHSDFTELIIVIPNK